MVGLGLNEDKIRLTIAITFAVLPLLIYFIAKFPEEQIGAYDAYSYDAADTLIRAILKVAAEQGVDQLGSPAGRDAIIAAVAATDFQGVTGQVKFDANGDTLNKAITVYRVENGAWTPFIVPEL